MTYPKPIMKISELVVLGYSREYLIRCAHSRHGPKCFNRTSRRGNWMCDTEKFDELKKHGYFERCS